MNQSRTRCISTTMRSFSKGSLAVSKYLRITSAISDGVWISRNLCMNRPSLPKLWSTSSCVWPVRKNWQVTLARFCALTWLTHHLKPLWFLNSRHVLSCCSTKCVEGRCSPCCCNFVKRKLSISVDAFPSFFVSGAETKYKQHRPCACRHATWQRAFWKVENSFPLMIELLGISHFAWSIPSPIITVTVWPRSLDKERASQ